jgi:aspartate racemase
MRLLGLIGGLTWESTKDYYRIINEIVKERLGGWHSAKLLLYSVDFDPLLALQNENNWEPIHTQFTKIAQKLELAGCEAIVICSNTSHKSANHIQEHIKIPIIHVVDATAEAIKKEQLSTVGLLGTKFTMEGGFYKERMEEKHGLRILLPISEERQFINNTIYKELALGKINDQSKHKFIEIIDKLITNGAQGIILGCTEIPMLISQSDCEVPLFDTLKIHLETAVDFMLN